MGIDFLDWFVAGILFMAIIFLHHLFRIIQAYNKRAQKLEERKAKEHQDRFEKIPEWADDVCMCGMAMDDHTGYDGHMAVSMAEYYREKARSTRITQSKPYETENTK